jgi:hypothetical protein
VVAVSLRIQGGEHIALAIQHVQEIDVAIVRRPLREQDVSLLPRQVTAGRRLLSRCNGIESHPELADVVPDVLGQLFCKIRSEPVLRNAA